MRLTTYFFSIIRRHKGRYAACIIGFGVGLAAVFGISAYTALLEETVGKFYFIDDTSFMVISKGTTAIQIIPFESEIPENVTDFLEEQTGVFYTFPMIFKDISNSSQFKYLKTVMVGADLDLIENNYLQEANLETGRFPEKGTNEILIGNSLKNEDFALEKIITVREANFTIVGILKTENPIIDHFIFADFEIVQSVFNLEGKCTLIYTITDGIHLNTQEKMTELEFSLNQIYPAVNLLDQGELDENLGFFYNLIDMFNIILSTFPLVISGLFIMVLMLLNVKDQEREFGMLRAIGMPIRSISFIIFNQSLFIGILGYLISILVGNLYFAYGFSVFNTLNEDTNMFSYMKDLREMIPPQIYIKTLLISLSMTIFIAIYPVIWTFRKSIVQSFRKEE
jgi:ABC-type antimicrobial peptide transport system permease subunit